ncbi:MAG: hypothetical protein IPJ79_16880 [Bacteroidetes bacterium]|nr:hypothetical protein [Bacteroidota bacterium]
MNELIANTKGTFLDHNLQESFEASGYEYFKQAFKEFIAISINNSPVFNYLKENYSKDHQLDDEQLKDHFLIDITLNKDIETWILIYEYFFQRHTSELGHFFRYLNSLIKYAIQERENYGDERKYIDIIQTQLTDDQLGLIFYNVLSKYGRNQKKKLKFKKRIDKYQLLENIKETTLIHRNHHTEYEKTIFRF